MYGLYKSRIPIPFNLSKNKIILESIKNPYDIVINLETDGSCFKRIMHLIRAKEKYGPPYIKSRHLIDDHAVITYQMIVKEFLNKLDDPFFGIPELHGINDAQLLNKFALLKKPYIILSPATSAIKQAKIYKNYRSWPAQYWYELIEKKELSDFQLVIVGTRTDLAYFNFNKRQNLINLCGKTSLQELVTLIKNSELIVTTDTGTAHIGSAVNANVLALFGPSNQKHTAPFIHKENQAKIHILSLNLPCSPCQGTTRQKQCPLNRCMLDLTPAMVSQKIGALLNK